jgi:hypothetical protein
MSLQENVCAVFWAHRFNKTVRSFEQSAAAASSKRKFSEVETLILPTARKRHRVTMINRRLEFTDKMKETVEYTEVSSGDRVEFPPAKATGANSVPVACRQEGKRSDRKIGQTRDQA